MTTPLRVDGGDISNWQAGPVGWKAMGDAGLLFLYHKATEGTNYTDPRYKARQTSARRANRKKDHKHVGFGAYHFARPSESDGTTQAKFFLTVANPQPGEMAPMLDLEDRGGLTKAKLTAWVGDFVAEVKRQTGVEPVIYTKFDLGHHHNCALWTASYADDNRPPYVAKPWSTWTIWQFSDGRYGVPTKAPGMPGGDLNTINAKDPARVVKALTIPRKRKPAAKKPAPRPAPKPAPAPIEKVEPAKPTRVENFREEYQTTGNADTAILERAAEHRKGGAVARMLRAIRRAISRGPKK